MDDVSLSVSSQKIYDSELEKKKTFNRPSEYDERLDYAVALSLQQEGPFTAMDTKPKEKDSPDIEILDDKIEEDEVNHLFNYDEDLDYAVALSLQNEGVQTNVLPKQDHDVEILEYDETKDKTNHDESLDYALALSLQEDSSSSKHIKPPEATADWDPRKIVDSSWELVDPVPNIHDLFVKFDAMFFNCTLVNGGVAVDWSKKMTLCAGVCCYEGRGGLCHIKLSEPLLKLRPRKDLVETLLHEMIHALLFVTANNRDREGHGPEFQKHMNRINAATGANISIYHSFHNEVKVYRQHWWKCDGPCQKRPPFYGIVRRAVNRPPSPNDHWWSSHASSCGGTYVKIKEPEGYSDKKQTKKKGRDNKLATAGKGSKNIVDMFTKGTSNSSSNDIGLCNSKNSGISSSNGSEQARKPKIINGTIVLCSDSKDEGSSDCSSPQPVSRSAEYEDIRSRTLAAVEKRLGVRNKPHTITKRQQTLPSNPSKRQKLICEDDVVLIIDNSKPSPSPAVTVSNQAHSTTTEMTMSSCAMQINKVTCPVCGRGDIPSVVLGTHIEYCLEEMELDDVELI